MKPEAVVEAFFRRQMARRYRDAASLMTPDFLAGFREFDVPHLRPYPVPTLAEYRERKPDVPDAVLEYWASNAAEYQPQWSDYFARIESEDELAGLDDTELYARRLEATDPSARYGRYMDLLIDENPEYERQLTELKETERATWRFDWLRAVEREDRAYVLCDRALPADDQIRIEPRPHVVVLRRSDDRWLIAADPSPYAGTGMMMHDIPIVDDDGNRIVLTPRDGRAR